MLNGPYRVRTNSEQLRDVYACDLARSSSSCHTPDLTIEAYNKALRSMMENRALLRDCGAMISSLGLTERNGDCQLGAARPLPITLRPTPVPKKVLNDIYHLSALVARIMDCASLDSGWTAEHIESCSSGSTGLIGLWHRVIGDVKCHREQHRNDIRLNILQQDYACGSSGQPALLKVRATPEFAGVPQKVSCLHRMTALTSSLDKIGECELPDNKPANEIATAIAESVRLYNERFHRSSRDICIVTSKGNDASTDNDDRLIEAALLMNHGIASHRRTARELAGDVVEMDARESGVVTVTSVLDSSRRIEVALFYFQHGSIDWDDEIDRQFRFDMERSKAVKCPSLEACVAELGEMQISWRSDADKFFPAAGLVEQPSDELLKAIAPRDGVAEDTKDTTLCAVIDVRRVSDTSSCRWCAGEA
ncbi:hypothetical protein FOL47_010221 [Perkinsus chesapeaki]|uniref:Glutathione synthase substrate-binding domain-containing protein n=1 Tax=Perkinsus chesapeaki TaxID=330153 RepID=A0A7J6L455_PERCH|nr:hypothetical protein FOL47_010221 [Perkinsus chesapeaki]